MSAILMDTHALIWFANGDAMARPALDAILAAQQANAMYVSPISAWEASLASRKHTNPADLGGLAPSDWFRFILEIPGVRLTAITRRIALEAAQVPSIYGSGDPGDCFLIATARLRKVPLVTRDGPIIALSRANPGYLSAIFC
jgi:PIN domain nuclease of toxin-antitoxin system